MASSDDAHNGLWKPLSQAAQSVHEDTHERIAVDNNRIYFAGLSGTARFAATLAQICKCAAGVLLDGAGFERSSPPAPHGTFAVFLTVGNLDFNYGQVVDLSAKLGELHYAQILRRNDGPHEWAPAGVMEEAFAWFRLMAMKDGRETRDAAFVEEQAAEADKRAKTLALSGDAYGSWLEYRQDAETFDGLSEEEAFFRKRADALKKEKAVLDGTKLDRKEIEEQSSLTDSIYAGMDALRQSGTDDFELRSKKLESQISNLRIHADHEKNSQKLLVDQRTLAGISMEALETGENSCRQRTLQAPVLIWSLRLLPSLMMSWRSRR
ncbi:MAG TPA: hypothetical protein VNE63_17250 [Candidatus Acidoferrales bacterium]|nr:hypothetical protein [Candidatus Acidoferrales bacterium]